MRALRRMNRSWPVVPLAFAACASEAVQPLQQGSLTAEPQSAISRDVPDVGWFIQIPGPNPILRTGDPAAWDGDSIEAAAVLKDGDTYYLYYHGQSKDTQKWHDNYRIGVATASRPLGPWKKYEGNPIVDLGPRGAWDDDQVACATVLKEKGTFYLWYCAKALARDSNGKKSWGAGLATSSSPLGPWRKYAGNPVVRDFGYVGGVVKYHGQLRMYSQAPIGFPVQDLGEIRLATAPAPEGPWQKHPGNPVLPAGDSGAWDAGGFSEFNVLHHDGVFHAFYSSAKWKPQWNGFGNIGYSYSYDGEHFIKYPGNPVAVREAAPDISTFSEVHSLFESPFYYVFHTQTYISNQGEAPEHIGVQVLATRDAFNLAVPVLQLQSLPAGKTTALDDSPPLGVGNVSQVALTVECKYGDKAKKPVKVHVRPSWDGIHYDTVDALSFENALDPNQTARRTTSVAGKFRFLKVLVENPDPAQNVADLQVIATLAR